MKRLLAIVITLVWVLTACSGNKTADTPTPTAAPSQEVQATEAAPQTVAPETGLQTLTPGKLTIATGQPAWEPWVLNDDPESGEGFEAAVAYAVAGKLGFAKEDVVWVRTSFEAAIQPGLKDFDFNLQQYSITDERKQVVDFSSAYYKEPRVVITRQDGDYASATSIAELKSALFGA
ncbi:MAG: transporter substrate-binding domain-containing protein, partial [Clostridiales bacterium]|nr:transporter substrate-binding domain-containing protein [Clostridiales bacterium]